VTAAEVVEAVRDLHKPRKVALSGGSGNHVTMWGRVCSCCGGDGMVIRWPCPTARLVYSDAERASS
jgi:hypothetical protein